VRVEFLSQEHNTMSLVRARTRTAQTETSAIITYGTTSSQLGDIGKLIRRRKDFGKPTLRALSSIRAKGRIMDHKSAINIKKKRPQPETLANKDLTFKFLL